MIKDWIKNRELIWTILAYGCQLIGSLFLLKVLTNILNHQQFGEYNLLFSATQFLLVVCFSPLNQAAGRYSKAYKNASNTFFYVKKVYNNANNIVLLIAVLICLIFLYFNLINWSIAIFLAILASYIDVKREFLNSIFHVDRKRQKQFYVIFITSFLRIMVPIVLFMLLDITLNGVLLGWIIASFFGYLVFHKGFNKEYNIASDREIDDTSKENIKKFAKYFCILSLFLWCQMWVDRWVISSFLGSSSVGLYAPFSQLASAFFTGFAGIMTMFSVPIFYEVVNKAQTISDVLKVRKSIKKYYLVYVVISCSALICIHLVKEFIFHHLLGKDFLDSAEVFTLLCCGWLLFNLGQLQAASIHVTGKIKKLLTPNLLSGIISIVLNVILILTFGVKGAAYGFLLTNIARCLLLYYYEKISWLQFSTHFNS